MTGWWCRRRSAGRSAATRACTTRSRRRSRWPYSAGPFVVLHETAHAWFNGRLVADRWISEAFASFYAQRAAAALKVVADPPTLTPELEAAAIPLNAWPGVGRASEKQEDYAYAATFKLAGLIAGRAGDDGLKAVWKAAAAGEYAYQPYRAGAGPGDRRTAARLAGTPRPPRGAHDRRLHGPLAGVGRSARPTRDCSTSARRHGRRTRRPWSRPGTGSCRGVSGPAMSAWQFDQATTLIGQVRTVLAQRTEISARSRGGRADRTADPADGLRERRRPDRGPGGGRGRAADNRRDPGGRGIRARRRRAAGAGRAGRAQPRAGPRGGAG